MAAGGDEVGDVLLASGSGGLYQARTPVALIVSTTIDGALARPMADPGRAEAVIVEPASNANVDEPPPPTDLLTTGNGGAEGGATGGTTP